MTQIARKEREELNSLSKSVFGTASRWAKLVNQGYTELVTEDKEETVPAEKEGEASTTRVVKVPVLKNGAKQYVVKHHTVESIRTLLLSHKTQLDAIRQMMKEQQENARAKEQEEARAKELQGQISGSAV